MATDVLALRRLIGSWGGLWQRSLVLNFEGDERTGLEVEPDAAAEQDDVANRVEEPPPAPR